MASDGKLLFETGIDNSGFTADLGKITTVAATAVASLTAAFTAASAAAIDIGMNYESSMSQVAATMGITSAAADFQVLSDAAKEMGESTKFSASQAGEALNYLALAGYNAEKSVAALPTVLNVAAAGGMELASASDMVTDAMSALGLETAQMSVFADQLAVTSQKSNTSVAQLGEAILTVGGTAKTLSGGVTEMNTALGILADNGIKGSEGGTALRNVILSLSAPTDTAAAALDRLNVKAFDSSGAMRPLQDTFADLNTALSALSDQEKTAVLNEIFNKVDLKSVNALLGTSAERFDELSGYIDNCSGAAAQMAATMNDNLKGDLTILQSALEGLGIAAYEKFQTPMRTAVQEVTDSVGELTESLSSGELSESFETIASAMSSAASSIMAVLSNDIVPALVTGFSTIIEYGDLIIAMIGGIAAAIAIIEVVSVITKTVQAIQTATVSLALLKMEAGAAAVAQAAEAGSLTLTELAAAALTGQITLLTAVKSAWSKVTAKATLALAKLNTVLSATTLGIAAVGAALIVGALAFKNYVDNMETAAEADPWTKKYDEQTRAIREEQSALEELKAAREESNKTDNTEIDNIQRLWSELQNYVDETGNVIAENERATEIIELLNKNYGINIDCIDGQIQGYKDLSASMDDYIANLRLESQIRNGQDAYDEAVSNYQEYVKKREALLDELDLKEKAFTKAREDGNTEVAMVFGEQANSLKLAIEALDEIIDEYSEEMSEYESLFSSQMLPGGGANPLVDFVSGQMSSASKLYADSMQTIASAQEAATTALSDGWKQLEHDFATGAISSESELWSQKSALLDQYGNADLEEHWRYYEELYSYQQDYAEESVRLAEKASEEQVAARQSEWENIDRLNNLGLLSDEDAAKARADFVKKYFSDADLTTGKGITDENYRYLQKVHDDNIDMTKQSLDEQNQIVDDGLSAIIKRYRQAYDDLEQKRKAYRDKLMAVGGDLFSVDVAEDENGKKKTVYTVNNAKEQLRAMREYHASIKKLRAEGMSDLMLSDITSMNNEDSMQFAKYLSGMSASEFAQINELYNEKQKLADELANDLYKDDAQLISDSMTGALADLATSSYAYGKQTAEEFAKGFTEAANKLELSTLYSQLQATGSTRTYENYLTVGQSSPEVEVTVTPGKTSIYLDSKKIGEANTEYEAQQSKITGK